MIISRGIQRDILQDVAEHSQEWLFSGSVESRTVTSHHSRSSPTCSKRNSRPIRSNLLVWPISLMYDKERGSPVRTTSTVFVGFQCNYRFWTRENERKRNQIEVKREREWISVWLCFPICNLVRTIFNIVSIINKKIIK